MENKSNTQPIIQTEEFTCDLCGEKFATVTELEEHKLRHAHPERKLADTQREIRGDIGAAGMPASPIQ